MGHGLCRVAWLVVASGNARMRGKKRKSANQAIQDDIPRPRATRARHVKAHDLEFLARTEVANCGRALEPNVRIGVFVHAIA